MSAIECCLQAGYTFTARLRDPMNNYVLLATGISVSEPQPGIYRISTGSQAGVVLLELLLGSVVFAKGYADLSNPGPNGYSEAFDTLAGATEVTGLADDVTTQVLAGLTGVEPKIVSAYDPRKKLLTICKGDDLDYSKGTQVDMQVNLPPGYTVAASVKFGARKKDDPTLRMDADATLVTLAGKPHVRLQLAASVTNKTAGDWEWDARITDNTTKKTTLIGGPMILHDTIASF